MDINELISKNWALFGFWLLICIFYYYRWVLNGSSFIYNPSRVFYHKYLLEEKSILNKIYFTKNNTYENPRIKQISFIFAISFFILTLILVLTIISTSIRNFEIILFILYANGLFAGIGFATMFVSSLIIVLQSKKCEISQELLKDAEVYQLDQEIIKKHPSFWT